MLYRVRVVAACSLSTTGTSGGSLLAHSWRDGCPPVGNEITCVLHVARHRIYCLPSFISLLPRLVVTCLRATIKYLIGNGGKAHAK